MLLHPYRAPTIFFYIFRDGSYVRVSQSLGRVYVAIGAQGNPKDIADISSTQNEEKYPKKFKVHRTYWRQDKQSEKASNRNYVYEQQNKDK